MRLDSSTCSVLAAELTTGTPLKEMRYVRLDLNTQQFKILIIDHGEADTDATSHLIHTTLSRANIPRTKCCFIDAVFVLYLIDVDGYPLA